MIKERGAVKPALDVIIDRDYAQQMPLAECGGFDAAAREFDGALPREQGVRGCSRGTNALQYELRTLLGRASRGIERDFESPAELTLGDHESLVQIAGPQSPKSKMLSFTVDLI